MFIGIVSGAPATGKTSLARAIRRELDVPLLENDTVKEFLFSLVPPPNLESSWQYGGPAASILRDMAAILLEQGRSCIIEGAFQKIHHAPDLQQLIDRYNPTVFELHCQTDPDVRRARYINRLTDGSRNPGHFDAANALTVDRDDEPGSFGPLELGRLTVIDTTDFAAVDPAGLAAIMQPYA